MYTVSLKDKLDYMKWLLQHLEELLESIGILSTGHLPPLLFSPYSPQECNRQCYKFGAQTTP